MNPEIHKIKQGLTLGSKICVLGSSGSGKSTIARDLVEPYPRKIYVDLMREPEYDNLPSVANLADFYRALKFYRDKKRFDLVYRMSTNDSKESKMNTMNDLCKLVFAFKNVHFFIDECDVYSTTQALPPAYEDLLRRGRHNNVSMCNVTQTPTNLNKMVIKQSTDKLYGFFGDRNDLNYVYSVGTWSMDDLLAIKKYEFIYESNREWVKVKL